MYPLAIYIHWPFCKSKCPYCDFNSHVRETVDEAVWEKALLSELRYFARRVANHEVASIFFGGGTPSLMEPHAAGALIEEVHRLFPVQQNLEITLEANPTSVEAARFAEFRATGINRVSLGVQAMNDAALAFLGRHHSAREAVAAVELAGRVFPRHSFDLIYARPCQTVVEWEKELSDALHYANGHISLYQLTIEEGTAFHHAYHHRKEFALPNEEISAALYEATQSVCGTRGLPAYEISNHAQAGEESRHNLAYWKGHSYIGIGPGAHGRIQSSVVSHQSPVKENITEDRRLATGDRVAMATLKSPERWLASVARLGHGLESETLLSPCERVEERVMMGLRLAEGIDLAGFEMQTGKKLEDAVNPRGLGMLTEQRLLEKTPTHLRASQRGKLLLSQVTAALLDGIS